jgi:glycosyltransferase involved in cell wall biosynthesis
LRVAVVHNLGVGGAHRRLAEQVANLGAEVVEVCLSTASPITDRAVIVPYRRLALRVPRVARPPLRYVELSQLERAWRRVASAIEDSQADVVYANPCQFLQAPAALLTTTLPSLYFCDEPRASNADAAKTRNPLTRTLYARLHAAESRLDRAAVTQATALATNSGFTAHAISHAYGREATVLPMGIPPSFTPSWEPAEHLLSVGTLIPDKGHDIVLRAASLARNRRPVVIVAPRDNHGEQRRLVGLAAQLGVVLRVRVGISDAELIRAYRQAHATLYLAREEPFGLASLEAQACASPVIVSAAGGLPETLRDGETGWAVPRVAAVVAAHLDLLDDPDLRLRMARSAASVAGEVTWARATNELERALENLCNPRTTSQGAASWTS